MDAHRRTDFTPPRLAEHRRRLAAGHNKRSLIASIIAVGSVAAVILGLLFLAGLISRSVSGDGSSVTPDLSFDSVVNSTVGGVIDLLPSAFSDGTAGPTTEQPSVEARTPTPAPTPSPTPAPTVDPATVQGNPLSLSSLTSAWEAKGMKPTVLLANSETYRGFSRTPAYIQLKNNGRSMELAVFVYPNRSAITDDWNTPTGQRPSPKDGRNLPGHQSLWWNKNTVVVVLTDPDGLSSNALNAYLDAR